MTSLFPMFMKLAGRQVPGRRRGKSWRAEDRRPHRHRCAHPCGCARGQSRVREWAREGKIELELRAFARRRSRRTFLAVVATASRSLNERIYREAQRRGVFCNVVDVPEFCDFFYPAVVRRGDLQIAISTAGQSPSLAQKIRQQLERQFGPGYAAWVAQLGETRSLILASDLDKERKLDLLHSLASKEAFEAALAKLPEPELAAEGEGA